MSNTFISWRSQVILRAQPTKHERITFQFDIKEATMNLSEHFTLAEMIQSQTAIRRGIDNSAPADVVDALKALAIHILEPVRQQFGPVFVSSGYRCPGLNAAVGGAPNSQHVLGQAADILVSGSANLVVARWIRDNTPFDQVIMEGGWVHASYGPRDRRQPLTAHFVTGLSTSYTQGLD